MEHWSNNDARGPATRQSNLKSTASTSFSHTACYSIIDIENSSWHTKSPGVVSQLILFLRALSFWGDEANDRPGNGVQGGFPRSLHTFCIWWTNTSSAYAHSMGYQSALTPCENLRISISPFQTTPSPRKLCVALRFPCRRMAPWRPGIYFAARLD